MNVTEQRQTQEALRQSEALFGDMPNQAPAMVWVTDPDWPKAGVRLINSNIGCGASAGTFEEP
jgi:PAS domain-containing protein